MRMNTRFNPTVSSDLHVGHIMMALINEYQAKKNGGKFIVRLDDNQEWWNLKLSRGEIVDLGSSMLTDLHWMGIEFDKWTLQSAQEDDVKIQLNKLIGSGPFPVRDLRNNFLRGPKCLYTGSTPYPYAPTMTAEAVILDYLDAISHLIRGEDLVFQGSLYAYFCDLWRLPMPQQIYLGRLTATKENGEVIEISKTDGCFKICDLRNEGYEPEYVLKMLSESCLKEPSGLWSYENVKTHPTIDLKKYPLLQ